MTIAIAVFWIACGVLDYGFSLAHFQRKFNYHGIAKDERRRDVLLCAVVALLGPWALLSTIFIGFTDQGWMLFPLSDDQINYGGKES